jgi:hypothetical protein
LRGKPAGAGNGAQQDAGRAAYQEFEASSRAVEYFVSYYDYYQPGPTSRPPTYRKEATISDELIACDCRRRDPSSNGEM